MTTTFRDEPPYPVGRALRALGTAAIAGMLMSACGSNVLVVGHDDPSLDAGEPPLDAGEPPLDAGEPLPGASYATRAGLAGEPPAGSGIPTVIATRQSGTPYLVVDDKRIYWTTYGPTSSGDVFDAGQSFLRSCAKDDCAGTLVTYATNVEGSVRSRPTVRASSFGFARPLAGPA